MPLKHQRRVEYRLPANLERLCAFWSLAFPEFYSAVGHTLDPRSFSDHRASALLRAAHAQARDAQADAIEPDAPRGWGRAKPLEAGARALWDELSHARAPSRRERRTLTDHIRRCILATVAGRAAPHVEPELDAIGRRIVAGDGGSLEIMRTTTLHVGSPEIANDVSTRLHVADGDVLVRIDLHGQVREVLSTGARYQTVVGSPLPETDDPTEMHVLQERKP